MYKMRGVSCEVLSILFYLFMASSTNPARGMRDFLPSDVRKREYVIGIIKEVYESYGFEPLETPSVENIETLMGKYGEEGNQLIFKILKRGDKLEEGAAKKDLADLALRYDLTVPLARVVAHHKNDLPKFFKRYQIQPVWRADRPAKGRYREFYQCDVDAIGSDSMIVEAELISAASEILERLGFEDFNVRINHRKVLTALLEAVGISKEKQIDALVALDKIDKVGREGVKREFDARGIDEESGNNLLAFFEVFFSDQWKNAFDKQEAKGLLKILEIPGELAKEQKDFDTDMLQLKAVTLENEEMADRLRQKLEERGSPTGAVRVGRTVYDVFNDILSEGLFNLLGSYESYNRIAYLMNFIGGDVNKDFFRDLINIVRLTEGALSNNHITIDPTLARGLSYYTGSIIEINVPDLAGSLAGGGRYDGLIGMFGKEQIPACGLSLGLERILVVMEERGMFPPEIASSASADVMVTVWNEESVSESLKLANELRSEGLRVLVYPEADKLGKQFKYAGQISMPYVCVIGESELAEGNVTVKNMVSGEQETVSRTVVAEHLRKPARQ